MKKSKVKDVEFVEVTKDVESVEEVVETVVEETVENIEEVEAVETVEEVVEETVEAETEEVADNIPDPEKCVEGKLVNCTRLNVREAAKKDAKIVKIINDKTSVMINLDESTDDFYYVYGIEGFEGYCSKEFMNVK